MAHFPSLKHVIFTIVLANLFVVAGCSKSSAPESPKNIENNKTIVITLGLAAPLTGAQAHLGKDMENGARMAVEELNATKPKLGNHPAEFKLMVADDMGDPEKATAIAQKFIDKGVSGVIGHLNSATTIAAAKVYNSKGIVQISPSASADVYTEQAYKTAYRVIANDSHQAKALARYAVNVMGAKNIVIVDDRTADGQSLADEFEAAIKLVDGVIIAREFTNDKATDFKALLTKIKSQSPDLLFFAGMDTQGALLVRQMHELSLSPTFLGGDGIRTAEFIKNAGKDAEGAMAVLSGEPLNKTSRGVEFEDKFAAKYGVMQVYAPYAYDAVYVMATAMMQAQTNDPLRYITMLPMARFAGITATIAFDEKGDLQSNVITLYKVVEGGWQAIETVVTEQSPQAATNDDFYNASLPAPATQQVDNASAADSVPTAHPVLNDTHKK